MTISLEKYNGDRHILISIHDRNGYRIGFLDNEKPGTLHYYDDCWHRYLAEGSSTFDFSVYKNGLDISMLNEENYVSFHFEHRDHLFKIRKTEETETEITCYCESTNLELLNEMDPVYTPSKSMSLAEYFNTSYVVGTERYSNVTLGVNEVSDKKLKLSWDGQETKLSRLLSIVNSFGAECEFVTKLNRDGTLNKMTVNVYKKHDDDHQGVGKRRTEKTLYYGKGIDSIRRTVDITDLITAIQPFGTKEVEVSKTKETVQVNLNSYKVDDVLDSNGRQLYYLKNGVIYAPQSKDRFPSTLGPDTDKWIRLTWDTEYSSEASLYGNALSKLKSLCEPAIEYEIEGDYDLSIGDTITVHDEKFSPALILEARVSEQEYSFTDPKACKNTFSNVKALENKLSSTILSRMAQLIDEATPIVLDVTIEGSTVMKNGSNASATLTGRLSKGSNDIYADSWAWYKDGEQVSTSPIITIDADDISGSSVYRVEAVKGARTYKKTVTMTQVKDGLGISDLKDQYTLSSSTSVNDGSDWSDSTVEYVDGKAVWSRYEITWDDGSKTYTSALYNPSATVGYQASFRCGELEADNAVIHGSLSAHDAHFTELETDNANIKNRLTATEGDITTLTSDNVTVRERLTAAEGSITTLSTDLTTAQTLIAEKAAITDLDAATGRIAFLESGKADIGDLTAVSTRTGTLEAGVANINLLLSGSTVSGSTQTIVLNAQNCTIDTAFFENLISSYVTAGYIFGDTISTNDFTIQSDDGGLEMADKTIQIKDSTRVRIQIGEDSSGDYNLYLWDEDGNLLWDAQGLTATGISRPIIKDSMVADNAAIAGSKLDINSVVTSINNGTTTIKGTLVKIGDQTLDVAFNTLNTTVGDHTTTIQSQATSITAIQGQISSLITDVQQLNENKADGSAVTTLTNNYNSLKQTVDGTVNDIGALQTTIATKADSSTVTTISDRQNTLSNTVDGLTQRITDAEASIETKADGSTVETIQSNFSTLSNTVDGLSTSVGTVTTTVNGTIASSITLFYSSDSTSVPALPTSKVTSTATTSKTWTTVVPTYNASYPYLYTCMQQTTVAGNVTWTKAVSGSYANYVSGVNTTANAGIKETTTLFYASATASTPSKPSSAVTTSSATTYGAWNKTLPTYSASYPYLYLCTQTQTNGGTYAWTNVESGSYADYISGLETRVSTAEQKITPDAITLAVNETVSNGTESLTNGSSFTLTKDTCTIDGAKLIISGSGKSLEDELDIEIGGRNLLRNSTANMNNTGFWTIATAASNGTLTTEYNSEGYGGCNALEFNLSDISTQTITGSVFPFRNNSATSQGKDLAQGDCITLSGWYYIYSDVPYTSDKLNVFLRESSTSGSYKDLCSFTIPNSLTDQWIRFEYHDCMQFASDARSDLNLFTALTNGYTCHAKFSGLKIEKGNKATNWTPAPEDVQSGIDDAKSTATDAQKAADDAQDYAENVKSLADLAQAAADDASDLAKQSLEQANEALGVLSPWKCIHDGKTYIDGSNIYTGTIDCAALNTETISALGAYISTLYAGELKSQDGKLTISLLSGQEGIEIKNETLHTKLKADADGTRVLNEDGTVVIAKFTADGTETANLIVSGTSYLSGLQLEKKDSGEIWAVYGG